MLDHNEAEADRGGGQGENISALFFRDQLQQAQADQREFRQLATMQMETMRQQIESIKSVQGVQQEKVRIMSDEIAELKQELKDAKKEIIANQEANYKRIIYIQGTVLFLVLSTVVGIAVKIFFH